MAYRSGTYAAFHAAGTSDPTASDIKYYRLLKAWAELDHHEFTFTDSHEKAGVRDDYTRQILRRALERRLDNSKNMVLIVGRTTRFDTDWVPFEISYAVDDCRIPIIAAYPGYEVITEPKELAALWPPALANRIANGSARVIHVPFKQAVLRDAMGQFGPDKQPPHGYWYYSRDAHRAFGINVA